MSETEAGRTLSPQEWTHAAWRKSSFSPDVGGNCVEVGVARHISSFSPNVGGNCVEAGPVGDGSERVVVRHSYRPDGEMIVYTRGDLEAFLAGVRNGEFDFFTT